ncbi:MAG TPA: ABC transporter permease [Gemmatimonadaceae bacterium]
MRLPLTGRRDAADRALDEEIRAHLAMAVADRIARGESPDAALATARREFGNVGHVKEITREAWGGVWLDRLDQDLRYALRSLRRAPIFATVAVLTLALGIGANTAMFTLVRGILLRPLPFRDPDALYLVSHVPDRAKSFAGPSMVDREYLDYRRLTKAFESTTSYNAYPATLIGAREPLRVSTAGVTPTFFRTLGVEPRLGRAFIDGDEASDAPVVILGAQLWRERFGADTAIIGRSVTVEGYRKTVIGVMPDGFEFPQHAQLWVPLAIQIGPRGFRLQPVIGRLAPRATWAQAVGELEAFVENEQRGQPIERMEHATPAVIPLREAMIGDVRMSLLMFAAAVGLVLLIACANVSNLMLMRSTTRRHELAIRAALGAGRWRLVRQLLTEGLVVALAGGAIGLAIARGGVALLLSVAPPDLLPRAGEIHIDLVVLLVTAFTCIAAGLISGAAPAITSARRDVRDALGDVGRTTARAPLRALFVTAEAALALMLLIAAGLVMRSFTRLRSVELGFSPDHLMTVTLDFPVTQYKTAELLHDVQRRLSAQIAAIPGVRSAAAVNWLPLTTTTVMGGFALEDGRSLPPDYTVLKPCVTPEYFSVMSIRVREGRGFLPSDGPTSGRVVVVSQSVARRFWPGESAIGKHITMSDKPTPSDWMTIVGVVDDVVQGGQAEPRSEAIYQALAQVDQVFWVNHLTFVAREDTDPSSVAAAMRVAVRAIDPQQPIESIMTMESRLSATVAEPRFRSLLLVVFSSLALVLAAIGIYGVLAYGVAERTREMGIRIALGAAPRSVVRLVLASTARLTIPGLALGIGASLVATRLLKVFLYQIQPTDPFTFGAATIVLLVVALCAGYGPARRASRIDPVITMK